MEKNRTITLILLFFFIVAFKIGAQSIYLASEIKLQKIRSMKQIQSDSKKVFTITENKYNKDGETIEKKYTSFIGVKRTTRQQFVLEGKKWVKSYNFYNDTLIDSTLYDSECKGRKITNRQKVYDVKRNKVHVEEHIIDSSLYTVKSSEGNSPQQLIIYKTTRPNDSTRISVHKSEYFWLPIRRVLIDSAIAVKTGNKTVEEIWESDNMVQGIHYKKNIRINDTLKRYYFNAEYDKYGKTIESSEEWLDNSGNTIKTSRVQKNGKKRSLIYEYSEHHDGENFIKETATYTGKYRLVSKQVNVLNGKKVPLEYFATDKKGKIADKIVWEYEYY